MVSRSAGPSCPAGCGSSPRRCPGVRSATFGVWVGVGSRDEAAARWPAPRTSSSTCCSRAPRAPRAMDISVALDAVGGEFNAFTAKEYTCFHARVLDSDLPLAVDVLGDMITSSLITAEDVEAEREVILDEIAMHDDDPDDVVHDLFAEQAWGRDAARPPHRRDAGVDRGADPRPDRALLPPPLPPREHRGRGRRQRRPRRRRTPGPQGVRAVGLPRRHDRAARPGPPRATGSKRSAAGEVRCSPSVRAGQPGARRATALVRTDDRRYALGVLNAVLGGGMSSRLFQEVREQRGLAYSVYSFASHYADAGMFGVGGGCLPAKLDEVLDVVRAELRELAERRHHRRRSSSAARASCAAGSCWAWRTPAPGCRGSPRPSSSTASCPASTRSSRRIDAVTLDDVQLLAKELFAQPETLAVVGPSRSRPGPDRVASAPARHAGPGSVARVRPTRLVP